jgi:hypothetical protein
MASEVTLQIASRVGLVAAMVLVGACDGGESSAADAGGSGGSVVGGSGGSLTGGTGGAPSGTLSTRYPGDQGLDIDPAVLFHDDFEAGWGRWTAPKADTDTLSLEQDTALANSGSHYLRTTVTRADLEANPYISSQTHFDFPVRVDRVFWRFYARFVGIAPNPHHWVRMAAGTDAWDSSGLANTVPPGNQGFWFDFDANNDDWFNFYVYWYKMRSGRCNDGTAVPGCAGDQGTTYYYGNIFQPPAQKPFTHDAWICIEIMGQANTVGASDGALAFWIDDQLVGDYRQGYPDGTWLRDSFHTGGCSFSACTAPVPFEGFDFRSSADVRFKQIFLDAYYQLDTFLQKKADLEARGRTVSDVQTILYDDVVVATERIGCRVAPP